MKLTSQYLRQKKSWLVYHVHLTSLNIHDTLCQFGLGAPNLAKKSPLDFFLRKKRSGVGSLHPGPVGDEPWLAIAAEYGAGSKSFQFSKNQHYLLP